MKFKCWPYLLLSPIYLLLGIINYWVIDGVVRPPLVVYSYTIAGDVYHGTEKVPHPIDEEGYRLLHAGDGLTVVTTSRRFKACILTINRVLQSEKRDFEIALNTSIRFIKPTDEMIKIDNPLIIPFNTVPGKYILYSKLTAVCNPFENFVPRDLETTRIKIRIITEGSPIHQFKPEDLGLKVPLERPPSPSLRTFATEAPYGPF